jgi:4-amino-4-deoxy-L-arabinose transferase-like glycosyltransferase
MWVSGDWITPMLNGLPYFEKPILQYWLTAALYSVLRCFRDRLASVRFCDGLRLSAARLLAGARSESIT